MWGVSGRSGATMACSTILTSQNFAFNFKKLHLEVGGRRDSLHTPRGGIGFEILVKIMGSNKTPQGIVPPDLKQTHVWDISCTTSSYSVFSTFVKLSRRGSKNSLDVQKIKQCYQSRKNRILTMKTNQRVPGSVNKGIKGARE